MGRSVGSTVTLVLGLAVMLALVTPQPARAAPQERSGRDARTTGSDQDSAGDGDPRRSTKDGPREQARTDEAHRSDIRTGGRGGEDRPDRSVHVAGRQAGSWKKDAGGPVGQENGPKKDPSRSAQDRPDKQPDQQTPPKDDPPRSDQDGPDRPDEQTPPKKDPPKSDQDRPDRPDEQTPPKDDPPGLDRPDEKPEQDPDPGDDGDSGAPGRDGGADRDEDRDPRTEAPAPSPRAPVTSEDEPAPPATDAAPPTDATPAGDAAAAPDEPPTLDDDVEVQTMGPGGFLLGGLEPFTDGRSPRSFFGLPAERLPGTVGGLPILLALLGAFLALQRGIGQGLGHVPMSDLNSEQELHERS